MRFAAKQKPHRPGTDGIRPPPRLLPRLQPDPERPPTAGTARESQASTGETRDGIFRSPARPALRPRHAGELGFPLSEVGVRYGLVKRQTERQPNVTAEARAQKLYFPFPSALFLVLFAELLNLRRREMRAVTPDILPGEVCCRWIPKRR